MCRHFLGLNKTFPVNGVTLVDIATFVELTDPSYETSLCSL